MYNGVIFWGMKYFMFFLSMLERELFS